MIVEEIMNHDVITLQPDDTIETAIRTIRTKGIRHIPIVGHNNNVVGIISDRDVRDASPSILDEEVSKDMLKQPIQLIMKQPVMTCHPLDFVEEIATLFLKIKSAVFLLQRVVNLLESYRNPQYCIHSSS